MNTQSVLHESSSAALRAAGHRAATRALRAARSGPKGLPDELKGTGVTEPTRPDRMAWVTEMTAIRDRKDQAAFARVFDHFAPRVKSFLMNSGASPDVAEDVAQDVMVTLWRKAAQFDPRKASVSTWIFTIARNRRIDVLRKQRRPEPEDLTWGPEPEPDADDLLTLQEDRDQLGEALSSLPEKQKDLVLRAYYGDLTHREIAEATGLPLGTIKSRLRLALDRLRHQMK